MSNLWRVPGKRFGLLAATALVVAAAVAVVVGPAFATSSTSGHAVPPPSTAGVTPTNVFPNIWPNDCRLFYYPRAGQPAYSFTIKDAHSGTYTDKASGATFTLTFDPPNTGNPSNSGGTWPAYASDKYFSFSSTAAAVVDVGVDGNLFFDTTHYGYSGKAPGWVSSDGYLHSSALSVDSKGNPTKLDGIDDLSFCYNQLAPISGSAFIDRDGSGTNNTGDTAANGLTVTLYNGSGTAVGTTTTDGSGAYTFPAEPTKAKYTVCINTPTLDSNGYLQTLPTSGSTCSAAGQAGYGVGITSLAAAGQANVNFGFEPLGSISGRVYQDNDQSGGFSSADTGQAWTVNLYAGASKTMSMLSSSSDGTYKFVLPLSATAQYTVCEAPPGGIWAQSQPLPSTGNVCNGTGELPKGNQPPIGAAVDANLMGNDFGTVAAVSGASGALGTSGMDATYNVALGTQGKTTPFVVNAGTLNGSGAPFVSLWAGDSTQQPTPLLEKIAFTVNALNPDGTLKHLVYTDTFPFLLPNAKIMLACLLDPSTGLGSTTLANTYLNPSTATSVLPSGQTSCVVSLSASGAAGQAGTGTLNAIVYSAVDGFRSTN